jgi:hypothetical protein
MTHKFYQLPIDTKFTIIGDDPNRQYKKISDTRAVFRVGSLGWGNAQFPFRKDAEVFTLDVPPVAAWEEFHIEITYTPSEHEGDDSRLEGERSAVTERFESELYRLVKKYQGQIGLKFYARNTESEITEY